MPAKNPRIIALFDVDGTLTAARKVRSWLQRKSLVDMPAGEHAQQCSASSGGPKRTAAFVVLSSFLPSGTHACVDTEQE